MKVVRDCTRSRYKISEYLEDSILATTEIKRLISKLQINVKIEHRKVKKDNKLSFNTNLAVYLI